MLTLISILSFTLLFVLLQSMIGASYSKKAEMQRRLSEIKTIDKQREPEDTTTFKEKLTNSMADWVEKGFYKNSKTYRRENLQKKLDQAGMSKSTTPVKYLSGLIIGSASLTLLTFLFIYLLTGSAGNAFLTALLILMIYIYGKHFMLLRRMTLRKNQMIRELPYTLDLILVSVEAGLSFDGALAKVIANIPGPISEEFAKTLKEIRMGIERKTAIRNMSQRCGVKELSSLNTAIIQADELGVSLSKIIRIQALTLREERRQKAREKALKAPVKILLPLILFVFPTIFIVILGPAVIQIMGIFK